MSVRSPFHIVRWLLLLLVTAGCLIGCKSETSDGVNTPTPPVSPIVGRWISASVATFTSNGSIATGLDTIPQVFQLDADGSFLATMSHGGVNGRLVGTYRFSTPILKVNLLSVVNWIDSSVHAGDSLTYHTTIFSDYIQLHDTIRNTSQLRWQNFLPVNHSGNCLYGVAHDSSQQALADAFITLARDGSVRRSTIANLTGFFLFSGVDNGSWIVSGSSFGLPLDTVSVLMGGNDRRSVTMNFPGTMITTGSIVGQVRNLATRATILNATVTIDGSNSQFLTDSSGLFAIPSILPRLVTITVSGIGFQSSTASVFVHAGQLSDQDLYLAPNNSRNGRVYGTVKDATTGIAIPGVSVYVADGTQTTTDSVGEYSFAVTAGTHAIKAGKTGYFTQPTTIYQVTPDDSVHQQFSLSPLISGDNPPRMRFVLTWSESPNDLDAHLSTPTDYEGNGEIYYGAHGDSLTSPWATLDHDVVSGNGPESISIHRWVNGTYKYFVKNYSMRPVIVSSQAVVNIYNQFGLLRQVGIPSTGTGFWWYVCDIDSNGTVRYVNRIQSTSPGSGIGKTETVEPPKRPF